MGFVGPILIKLVTSSIWGFFSCLCDVFLGVTYANMLVTTQWPLKHVAHLTSLAWVREVCRFESLMELSALWVSINIWSVGFSTQKISTAEICACGLFYQRSYTCVGNLTIIGSDNGLSPGRRQAIIWTNAGILLIGPLGTNFSEICIEIDTFSFKNIHLKMLSGKWRPFCLGLNVLSQV